MEANMSCLKFLLASCAVALTVCSANATTFDVMGAGLLSGTVDINVAAPGTVPSASLQITGLGIDGQIFSILHASHGLQGGWEILAVDSSNLNLGVILDFSTPLYPPPGLGQLIDFAGGDITQWTLFNVSGALAGGFYGFLTPEASATPLPAALPLFATGLGALGLLGWRRKRRAAAAT
jgi:hypothetical protein